MLTIPVIKNHPAREFIKRAGLSPYAIAQFLGVKYARCWEILAGRRPATEAQESKLQELIKQIELDAGGVAS